MSRLADCFRRLTAAGRTALVPYITAADPRPGDTVELMLALVEAGADVIELGVPFSDPMADGPVIQAAYERALTYGVTLDDVLGMVTGFRRHDAVTPVVLMGYSNPIEAMGTSEFVERAARAGVDGVITVDLPPEEARADGTLAAFERAGLDPVFLIAPTTSEERIQHICSAARGFLYYVSLKGVTGAGHLDGAAVAERLSLIRRYTSLPLAVGFGIKDETSAVEIASVADAVVIGSALVDVIADCDDDGVEDCRAAAIAFLRPIRAALGNGGGLKSAVN